MQARFSPFSTPDIPRSEPRTARMATEVRHFIVPLSQPRSNALRGVMPAMWWPRPMPCVCRAYAAETIYVFWLVLPQTAAVDEFVLFYTASFVCCPSFHGAHCRIVDVF
ncbi:hypothetical protein B0H11DRAFT_2292185 [Mycena galericulata]|nr:hypothetical protein B0H11DRAFT_2292185 [Mycena galericulata]